MPAAAREGNTVTFRNTAAHRHKGHYERDPDDYYVEPIGCSQALFMRERFYGNVYDPCCGQGHILRTAAAFGHKAYGSDIRARLVGQDWQFNFADPGDRPVKPWHVPFDNIVANPPFQKRLILPIIERALRITTRKVAMLVPAPFLYSIERYEFFQKHRPKAIYHLSSRPSMPPGKMLSEGIIKAVGGKEDYAWVVWSNDHEGPTITDWILMPEAMARREQKQARAAAAASENGSQAAPAL